MRKWMVLMMAVTLSSLLLLAGCGNQVVAVVNGEDITQQELDTELEMYKAGLEGQGADFSGEEGKGILEQLRQDVLKQLIDEKLLMQEVVKQGLEPTAKDIQDEIKNIKDNFKTEGEFKKFLTANGINEPQLQDVLGKQLSFQNLIEKVTKGIAVTDQEVQEYYQENKDSFTQPEERVARHILIGFEGNSLGTERSQMEAKVEATRLLEKIKQGADFVQLVKEYSEDPGSKDEGGLYTVTRGGMFAPEFEEAVFSLARGEVTKEPVKTSSGYHIIRLDEITPAREQPFDEVQAQIQADLENTHKAGKYTAYLEELHKTAKIDNKLAGQEMNKEMNKEENNAQE